METTAMRTGGQILADQLLVHGAELGFCVPGESYLELLDALYDHRDRFTLVNARHEAGAASMAEAHGKLTGRPGICVVTRGPGATHAAVGVHTAAQDSTPMLLIVGQVARGASGREAFQEIDYRALFGGIAKWVVEVDSAARIPELVSRAFHVATSGRCGPVVMAFPEDVLSERAAVPDAAPCRPAQPGAAAGDMARFAARLAQAERPLFIVGGGGWTDAAAAALTAFAARANVPVACSAPPARPPCRNACETPISSSPSARASASSRARAIRSSTFPIRPRVSSTSIPTPTSSAGSMRPSCP
jgi:acetolactate synthase-1/2/3 large subunit